MQGSIVLHARIVPEIESAQSNATGAGMDSEGISVLFNFLAAIIGAAASGILGIVGALIGAFVGGLATYLVGQSAVKAQRERDSKAEADEVRATLQAIAEELRSIVELHTSQTGGARIIEETPPDEPVGFFYPIFDRYFTVYEASASSIGRIPDARLRRRIVGTYVSFKGFVDTVRLNNEFCRQLELAELDLIGNEGHPVFERKVALHRQQMALYTPSLKESQRRCMTNYQQLMLTLEAYGV